MTVGWIGASMGAARCRQVGSCAASEATVEPRGAGATTAGPTAAAAAPEHTRAVDPAAAARALGLYADGGGESAERIFAALADDDAIEAEIERLTTAAAQPAREQDGEVGRALRALFGGDAPTPAERIEKARDASAEARFLESLAAVRGQR